jgi:succinylglutamate desuccinylase
MTLHLPHGAIHLLCLPLLASSAMPPLNSVTVVGGTHGNEYTGVFCVKALERRLRLVDDDPAAVERPFPPLPFELSTLIGNPEAFKQNKRFVDQDLNRQFDYASLHGADPAVATGSGPSSSSTTPPLSVEQKRARELDALLGPKFGGSDGRHQQNRRPPATDLIIDLHTTTANMGTSLIVSQGDPLTTQAAAYVMAKCRAQQQQSKLCILMHTHTSQEDRPHLASIAPHCLTIEVGPVPQGVVRHDKVEEMQAALDATLEFLRRHQQEPEKVRQELDEYYPDGRVPCYRSAPAIRMGEMSAKLVWPSDPENENFPAWLVHKDVQDRDFHEIREGDPLFVNLDGEVIPYDGSHGSPVILMFINEGGYYYATSGTGISVAQRDAFELATGNLIAKEEGVVDDAKEL